MNVERTILNMHLFRYHLLPISNETLQISLFPEKEMTKSEIIENKNDFFREAVIKLSKQSSKSTPMIIHWHDDKTFILKIANKKITKIYKDFKSTPYPTEPFVYVLINNDPNVQKIAISENPSAFTKPNVAKNVFLTLINKELVHFGLNISIKNIFDKQDFWKIIKKYESKVTYIDFQFVRPNLANISKSLNETFKDFSSCVNSHESHLTLKAPPTGSLENLDKKNETLKGLTEYSANGGGNIKIKIKGYKKQVNTNEKPLIKEIDELDIEGVANQVIPLFKTIIEDGND
jgi:hypothetical protein